MSRLRLALGDKRTAALLLGSGLPEEPGAALPPPPSPPIGTEFPRWAVEGEERKQGAGVLFFAYGGRQLERTHLSPDSHPNPKPEPKPNPKPNPKQVDGSSSTSSRRRPRPRAPSASTTRSWASPW